MQPAPYFERNGCALYVGDALATLRELPAASVQCCVTSPPYYGLRAYGTNPQVWDGAEGCDHEWGGEGRSGQRLRNGQGSETAKVGFAPVLHPSTGAHCARCGAWRGELGAEPTPDLYVAHLVSIFREVRRVLRDDGTCWLNIGDSFWTRSVVRHKGNRDTIRAIEGESMPSWREYAAEGRARYSSGHPTLKDKDLLLIPFRLALALQADGWWVRQDIIWYKRNCMPESVTDRPTTAHEHMFLLAKSERYFYDAQAVAEPLSAGTQDDHRYGKPTERDVEQAAARFGAGTSASRRTAGSYFVAEGGRRNLRSVWDIPPQPFTASRLGIGDVDHFAAFPLELARRSIRAGTSEHGCCPTCGGPHERVMERRLTGVDERRPNNGMPGRIGRGLTRMRAGDPSTSTTGWRPTCACPAAPPVPCTVLDPFAGAGTTLLAAQQLGRRAVGIELNPDYARIIEARVGRQGVLDFAAEEAAG